MLNYQGVSIMTKFARVTGMKAAGMGDLWPRWETAEASMGFQQVLGRYLLSMWITPRTHAHMYVLYMYCIGTSDSLSLSINIYIYDYIWYHSRAQPLSFEGETTPVLWANHTSFGGTIWHLREVLKVATSLFCQCMFTHVTYYRAGIIVISCCFHRSNPHEIPLKHYYSSINEMLLNAHN